MNGLIHYVYGKGPGKTTSAFGKVLRSIGHNHNPIIIQFLKESSDYPENERTYLKGLLIDVGDLIEKYHIQDQSAEQKGFTYGEYTTFTKILKVPVIQIGNPTFLMPNQERTPEFLEKFNFGMDLLERILKSDNYHLVVLDEINTAVHLGLVDLSRLLKALSTRNEQIEVILTGRENIPELVEIADYVTQVVEEKHPFQKGVNARIGIEF
ncbi:MAG: cob(I)yrinic acid a,c-diamide adenosyltransferase [Promethearchaeota archaeon]